MNCLRVNSIAQYQSELMGYNLIGNKIIYLTASELCAMRVDGKKRESVKLKGESVLNFAISERGYIALLYRSRSMEIRRLDCLGEVVHRFANIAVLPEENYPKLRWDFDELYLVYPDSLEILDVRDKSRRGYTDIVVDYEDETLKDMVITNIMSSERAAILQLAHRLIFTVIPVPITELRVPFLNSLLNLYSPSHSNDSRREFIATLSSNRTLKVFNFLDLKQVCEVDLEPRSGELLEMEADPNHECILIRHVSTASMETVRNVVYKVNSAAYYCESADYYSSSQPFFSYKFDLAIPESVSLLPTTLEDLDGQAFDYYRLVFFKKGRVYSALQLIPHAYSQSTADLRYSSNAEWREVEEWREVIAIYLELGNDAPKHHRHLVFSEQDRQVHEYGIIKDEFNTIVAKFTQRINEEGRRNALTERSIQEEWNDYMAQIAKERNFMIQTMQLFKIEPQLIPKHSPTPHDLETCINDMHNREHRIDAKIKEKKMEILSERSKDETQRRNNEQTQGRAQGQRSGVSQGKPSGEESTKREKGVKSETRKEELERYQEDYEKFVAEFMQQSQRKEREDREKRKEKRIRGEVEQRFILNLPNLNEEERLIINNYNSDRSNPSAHSHSQEKEGSGFEREEGWRQIEQIMTRIEASLNPLVLKLDPLIVRLSKLQVSGLERIKKNEAAVERRCGVNLEEIVKGCCRKMVGGLSSRVRKEMERMTRQIYELEDRNKVYYQQSIQRFRQFIKYQITNRIEIYYKSRRRLEHSIAQIKHIPPL